MTKIGSGFLISHFDGIGVNAQCVIGKNCNISQGVTLGQANRGKMEGSPIVGDNVYIGPGAKIVGAVSIGDDVAIGANCVVTKDVPDGAVVVGVPGRVISHRGSKDYVCRTDYEHRIKSGVARGGEEAASVARSRPPATGCVVDEHSTGCTAGDQGIGNPVACPSGRWDIGELLVGEPQEVRLMPARHDERV
jgi:hypothetical protein